ncbi:uncharacterized protein LOC106096145 isoform X4 [Stomoxys calcitrans]|uniref:Uncharacterized protein n=1 Tax=Stomoxys calcitrans TaxID=35570 RepID=A0A1I8P440_STOCA|nr:uncharacterized protein LOC106096145 isoform X4 [Stomoxys calcitrans]
MNDFGTYLIWLLVVIAVFTILRVCCSVMCQSMPSDSGNQQTSGVRRRIVRRIRIDPPGANATTSTDRQGNVFTIHDESTRESRYNDIFFIEPNSAEAARIRAQLEKDDKDLPSYEEVMRMTSVTSTTPANTAAMTASNASVNTAETRLSVPPYSEVDPNASSTSLHAVGNATTINSASAATPTTQTQSTPPPPLFAAAVVSSSVTQATLNV